MHIMCVDVNESHNKYKENVCREHNNLVLSSVPAVANPMHHAGSARVGSCLVPVRYSASHPTSTGEDRLKDVQHALERI